MKMRQHNVFLETKREKEILIFRRNMKLNSDEKSLISTTASLIKLKSFSFVPRKLFFLLPFEPLNKLRDFIKKPKVKLRMNGRKAVSNWKLLRGSEKRTKNIKRIFKFPWKMWFNYSFFCPREKLQRFFRLFYHNTADKRANTGNRTKLRWRICVNLIYSTVGALKKL